MHESRRHSPAKSVHLVPTRVQKIALRDNSFEHALLLCLQRGIGKSLDDIVARQAQMLLIKRWTTSRQTRGRLQANRRGVQ